MLFQLTFLSTALSKHCVPISNTTICKPWQNQQIDISALRRIYDIPDDQDFTPDIWQGLIKDITKKESEEMMFSKYLHCPGYEPTMIQYHTTYVCTVDLFVHSRKCNPNPQPLCRRECNRFERTVSDFVQDESMCPIYFRSSRMREIAARREEILYGVEHCTALFQSGIFSRKESCLAGVDIDRTSCGFGGDLAMGTEYCKLHPNAQCCSYMEIHEQKNQQMNKNETTIVPTESHWYDSMKRLVNYWSATDDIKENNANIRRKVGGIVLFLFCVFVLSIVGYILYGKYKQRQELERNRQALYEETRSFNSKYTPVLGDE